MNFEVTKYIGLLASWPGIGQLLFHNTTCFCLYWPKSVIVPQIEYNVGQGKWVKNSHESYLSSSLIGISRNKTLTLQVINFKLQAKNFKSFV